MGDAYQPKQAFGFFRLGGIDVCAPIADSLLWGGAGGYFSELLPHPPAPQVMVIAWASKAWFSFFIFLVLVLVQVRVSFWCRVCCSAVHACEVCASACVCGVLRYNVLVAYGRRSSKEIC